VWPDWFEISPFGQKRVQKVAATFLHPFVRSEIIEQMCKIIFQVRINVGGYFGHFGSRVARFFLVKIPKREKYTKIP
jgi:hypothetical protein